MRFRLHAIFLLSLLFGTSCASKKKIIYFQDDKAEPGLILSAPEQLIYKTDDLLTINVSAFVQETVSPFNLTVNAGNLSNGPGAIQGNLQLQTYLVDYNGNIDFPVLGTIKVAGLTRTELTELLTKKISEYANDPIVNVRLTNFTITVLGEVASPGTFTVPRERITLIEGIGLARDLTIYGNRKNVRLIREVDGVKRFANIDLTSTELVNSRNYYLQQNDVIYVEPNRARVRSSSYNQNNVVLISAIGTVATIVAIFLANSN